MSLLSFFSRHVVGSAKRNRLLPLAPWAMLIAAWPASPLFGQVLLEDFATMRLSGQTGDPYKYLWHGMTNQGPTKCTIANGTLVCTTAGTAADGLGLWFNSLNCDSTACYSDAGSSVKGRIKSGTWNENINRMRFRYKCSVDIAAATEGRYWLTIGSYVRAANEPNPSQSGQGSHHYHFINQPSKANEWVNVELNRVTQYRIGEAGDTRLVEDSEWYTPAQSKPVHYFDGLTHFYFGPTYSSELRAAGTACTFDTFTLDTVSAGADAYVSNIAGSYNPTSGRYDLSWNQPKNTPGGTLFDVRYSTTSMRTNGWNTGTPGGTAGPGQTDTSPYATINYSSPSISRKAGIYFAIRPHMRVLSASVSGTVRLKIHAEHFLSTGDTVDVSGVCPNANGSRRATVIDRDTISLDGTSGSCSYSGGGTVTATAETKNFAEFMIGQPSTSDTTDPFDLNTDGRVDESDTTIAINSALGLTACIADVNKDGTCDVVDVQRVINATSR